MAEFKEWPKIPRLNSNVVVTEKLDGTNACVVVEADGVVSAQSRSRAIVPGNDNYGFAAWVAEHAEELKNLGPGYHYGEWWGQGIQRRYGLEERRFSLFNAGRWHSRHVNPFWRGCTLTDEELIPGLQYAPECCHVVPILARGPFVDAISAGERFLRTDGSLAAPGWMKPEGLIVYLHGHYFKVLLENDNVPKSQVA